MRENSSKGAPEIFSSGEDFEGVFEGFFQSISIYRLKKTRYIEKIQGTPLVLPAWLNPLIV
jgi:hypothetical protein